MRVCLLSKMFPPGGGGSEKYAYEIANALGARGHDVDVFTQASGRMVETVETHENVDVYRVTTTRKYLVTFETLYYSIRTRLRVDFDSYDVIHGTLMPASTIGLLGVRKENTPIVVTSHSFALEEVFAHDADQLPDYLLKYFFHPMNVAMDNIAARSADQIIAISTRMKEQLHESYRISPDRITHVPHGVDSTVFRPAVQPHPSVSRDKITLLFVGRLVTRKRASLAIETLAQLDRDDVELLIAGTGRRRSQLQALARSLDLDEQVKFLGYVPKEELPLLYASSDLFLFMSNYEGFGLVILESMASGTPVVGRPVGGVPDVIEDNENGVITPGESEAIAERIEGLLSSPEELEEMSVAARERAVELSWDYVASRVEEVYRSL